MRIAVLLFMTVCALSLVACPGLPTATPLPEQVIREAEPTQRTLPQQQAPPTTVQQPPPTAVQQAPPTKATEPQLSLERYAANNAGGPGAVYVGILDQLAGPALLYEHGDHEGNIPLSALENYRFIFESDYYQDLLRRAGLTNPTPFTSQPDAPIVIQHACVNRAFMWCRFMEAYLAPNLAQRTGGMLTIEITSFPELGIPPSDTLDLFENSTLGMANTYGPSLGSDLPELEILFLYGLYPDHSQYFQAAVQMLPAIEQLLADATGRYPLGVNWLSGTAPTW